MSISQKFAKTALKTATSIECFNMGNSKADRDSYMCALATIFFFTAGAYGAFLESDPGNQYADEINQEYNVLMTTLEQQKHAYDLRYNNDDSAKEASERTSSIMNAINNANNAEPEVNYAADNEYLEIYSQADLLAKHIQEDSKLSEYDAGELAERLNNVVSFEDLGYEAMPDADDLRECQEYSSDASKINKCTISGEKADPEDVFIPAGLGVLLSLLAYPTIPKVITYGVDKNRERLKRMAKGRSKNPW